MNLENADELTIPDGWTHHDLGGTSLLIRHSAGPYEILCVTTEYFGGVNRDSVHHIAGDGVHTELYTGKDTDRDGFYETIQTHLDQPHYQP